MFIIHEQTEKISIKRNYKKEQNRNSGTEKNVTEKKNSLEWFNSQFGQAEEWISEPEYRPIEITQSEEQKEKRVKKKLTEPKRPVGHHQAD